jgi:hypothetical protein
MANKIYLYERFFTEGESEIFSSGSLKATLFTYSTGVKAVKISNELGSMTVLPYMGQMVWRADFRGYEMTMKSIYDEPMPARDVFHETYGGFLMHCGLTAMGNPTAEDTHTPHGELPICKYNKAWLVFGEDEGGKYLGISGVYLHKRCYEANYEFSPLVKIYEGKTYIDIEVNFKNNKDVPLEYYYLCHINHRPVNGARLSYTADRSSIKVNHEVPDNYFCEADRDKTNAYLDMLDKDQSLMDKMGEDYQAYRPEIVFNCTYTADENGNAYTMQINPDKTATYVSHRPAELPYGVRWISRTDDEDALGMVLPATAEHMGRLYCQRNNEQSYLKQGESVTYRMRTGYLTPSEAEKMEEKIKSMGF